tara:strand:- start:5542 stop:6054 length:513 start_codon:yes stop_codon:yes gene_type:complete
MIERQILVIEETRPADSSTEFFQDYAEANLGIRPEDGGRPIDGGIGGKQYSHTLSEIYNINDAGLGFMPDWVEEHDDDHEHSLDGVDCNPEEVDGVCICGPQSTIYDRDADKYKTVMKQSVAFPTRFNEVESDLFVQHMAYNAEHGITYEKKLYSVGEDWVVDFANDQWV